MSSTASEVHKIQVHLSTSEIIIEPGDVGLLEVTMVNRQSEADRLSVEIEGIDVEWYAIPVPAVNISAGASAILKIHFKVSRRSDNRSGSYPFLVRAQAMESGEVGVAQAALVLKPFSALQVEMNPKRATALFYRPLNDFEVTIENQGNTDATLELFATDPEDACAYEFDTDRVLLKPGQTVQVLMAVRPRVSSLIGSARLYAFTVTARSIDDSYISANAHGQIEKQALISPVLGVFALLLVLIGLSWLWLAPKPIPPIKINRFTAETASVPYGGSVKLSWDVSGGYRQIILMRRTADDSADINDPGEQKSPVGSATVTPEYPSTRYTLEVRGQGDLKSMHESVTVNVGKPPPIIKPVIRRFTADPVVVHQGDAVTLSWKADNASEYYLDPGSQQLSSLVLSKIVTPDHDTDFTLRAIGRADNGKPAPVTQKSVHVHVAPRNASIAEITHFGAHPSRPYIGDTIRLSWSTRFARSVRIDSDSGSSIGEVAAEAGSQSVRVDAPITFTLTAADTAGLSTTSQLSIRPIPRPPPPPTPDTPPVETPAGPDTGLPPPIVPPPTQPQ